MTKDILKYLVVFSIVFCTSYYIHHFFLEKWSILVPYSLVQVYAFNALFSLGTCVVFNVLSTKDKYHAQLGFVYIWAIAFKVISFCLVFYKPVLSVHDLPKAVASSLLIPIAIFIITEVYFIIEVLNRK